MKEIEDCINKSYADVGKMVEFMRWYGVYPSELNLSYLNSTFNPYLYGHPWEVCLVLQIFQTCDEHYCAFCN